MDSIYLDYAAATPIDDTVLASMLPYLQHQFYNPSATYISSRQVHQALQAARSQVAEVLGARTSEIIFTAGGTESCNLAIHGIMKRFPKVNLVTTSVEHDAVLKPAARYDHRIAKVNADGRLDMDSLRQAIDDQTVLVSIMYANNEVGTIQPLREAGQVIQSIRHERQTKGLDLPLYLHSDACQAANLLDLHVSRLGVDLLTVNGGKIYGPKQSGILYVKGGLLLDPLIDGGGQERGLRSGTENVAAAIGFAKALELAQTSRREESQRLQKLQALCNETLSSQLPEVVINGSMNYRLANNIHLTLPGYDNERLLIELDEAGIQAAAGSACSASSQTPSHVLRAMGLSDAMARSSVRLTMGRTTTTDAILATVTALAAIANRQ